MKILLYLVLILTTVFAEDDSKQSSKLSKDEKPKSYFGYNNYDFSNFGNLGTAGSIDTGVSGGRYGSRSDSLESGVTTGVSRHYTGVRFGTAYDDVQNIAPKFSNVRAHEIHTITQQVSVPAQQPVEITKTVPVPQPYPVAKLIPVEGKVDVPVEVAKSSLVKVSQQVPVHVQVKVPVEVPRPYPVHITKTVKVPVEKPVYIKVPHPVPVPTVSNFNQVVSRISSASGFGSGSQIISVKGSGTDIISGIGAGTGSGIGTGSGSGLGSQIDSISSPPQLISGSGGSSGKIISGSKYELTGSYVPSVLGGISGFNEHNSHWKHL